MAKQARYHQAGKPDITLDIVKEHPNGNVDLARGEEVLVTNCALSPAGAAGTATIITATEAKSEAKKADDKKADDKK